MFNTLSQQTPNTGTKGSLTDGEYFWNQSSVETVFLCKQRGHASWCMVEQQLPPARDTKVSLGKELLALSVTFPLKKELKGHHVLFKVKLT